jgi:hypothetical protein
MINPGTTDCKKQCIWSTISNSLVGSFVGGLVRVYTHKNLMNKVAHFGYRKTWSY